MPMPPSRETSAAAILDTLRGNVLPFGKWRPFHLILRDIALAYESPNSSTYVEEVLAQGILAHLAGTPALKVPQSLDKTFNQIAEAVGFGARGSVEANLAAWAAMVEPLLSPWGRRAEALGATHLWRLDEPAGSTTVEDAIGSAQGAVGGLVALGAAPLLTTGETSASFPGGMGNQIRVPAGNMPVGNASRSIVIWLASEEAGPADYNIWGYGNGAGGEAFGIQRSGALTNDELFFYVFGNDQTVELPGSADIADGDPHQLGVAYDAVAGEVIFNYDGVASPTVKNFGGAINTADTEFDIGGSNNIIGVRWNGREAYCGVWPLALTHAEMAELYALGS